MKKVLTYIFGTILIVLSIIILSSLHIVKDYEKVVLLRLGKIQGELGGGLHFVVPFYYKSFEFDMRTVAIDVAKQDVVTKDNVSVNVDAILYYKILDATKALTKLEDYKFAITELSQSTLRSVCGKSDFDELNGERQKLNDEMRLLLEEKTSDWGLIVENIEIKHIILHENMQTIMATKAIAYREAEALRISANAELEAAMKYREASEIFNNNPNALFLRKFALLESISENEATILLPIPNELLSALK